MSSKSHCSKNPERWEIISKSLKRDITLQVYLKLKIFSQKDSKGTGRSGRLGSTTHKTVSTNVCPSCNAGATQTTFICIDDFTLHFDGNQEWYSSFTFSSAFLLTEIPFVVIAWHWTSEIILVLRGDKSLENGTCFPPSAQQTFTLREHRMK